MFFVIKEYIFLNDIFIYRCKFIDEPHLGVRSENGESFSIIS